MPVLASQIKIYKSAVAVDFDPDSNGGVPGAEVVSGVKNNVLPDVQDYNIWGEYGRDGDGYTDWEKSSVRNRWRKMFFLFEGTNDTISNAKIHLTEPPARDDYCVLGVNPIAETPAQPRTGNWDVFSGVEGNNRYPERTFCGALKESVFAGASLFVIIGKNASDHTNLKIWIGTPSTTGEYFEGASAVYNSETGETTVTLANNKTLANAYSAGDTVAEYVDTKEMKPTWWTFLQASASPIPASIALNNVNTKLDRFVFSFSPGGVFTCTSDRYGNVGTGLVTEAFTARDTDNNELFTLPIIEGSSTCLPYMYEEGADNTAVMRTLPSGVVVWIGHGFYDVRTTSEYGDATLKFRMAWDDQRRDFEASYTLGVVDSPVLEASASECSVFSSEVMSDVAASNGGGLGTVLNNGLNGVVLPNVSGVEQSNGATRWRKLFLYAGGKEGRARLRLAGPTPGDDRIVVQHRIISSDGITHVQYKDRWFANTQEHQAAVDADWITLTPLCCGRLKANVASGATSFTFIVDGATEVMKGYDGESNEILVPAYNNVIMPIWIGTPEAVEHLGYCLCTQVGNEVTVTLPGGRTLANVYLAATGLAGNCRIVRFATSYNIDPDNSSGYELSPDNKGIIVHGVGVIHDTFTLTFTSTTEFSCVGAKSGALSNGVVTSDYAPINPETGTPYFTILSSSWLFKYYGGMYNFIPGDHYTFSTVPSHFPLWLKQTVPPNSENLSEDGLTLILDWDDGE